MAVLGTVVVAELGACRAPTQAEITIRTTVPCGELGEVAIVVSGSPEESERRTSTGFYAAQTGECDPAQVVGSLVVTPGGDRASVMIIGAPEGKQLSTCMPPLYRGCIVARRAFSFIDATTLKIPVSLDIECRDVPCDAFTTCKKGFCYSSELECSDSDCRLKGELPDGGVDKEAAVLVDGSPDPMRDAATDGSGTDGSVESGTDSGIDSGIDSGVDSGDGGVINPPPPPGTVTCSGGTMSCGGTNCPAPNGCCENAMLAESLACTMQSSFPCTGGTTKGRRRYCCGDGWCSQYVDTPRCDAVAGTPGNCVPL